MCDCAKERRPNPLLDQWTEVVAAVKRLECLISAANTAGIIDADRFNSMTAQTEEMLNDLVACIPTEGAHHG